MLFLWIVTADVTHNDTSSAVDNAAVGRALSLLLSPSSTDKLRLIQRRSIRKTSVVGSSVVLDCDVPPAPPPPATDAPPAPGRRRPGGSEYMVKWHKQGVEVPIYIQLDRLPAHVDANYHGRARLLADPIGGDDASLEISDVRLTDEGWYECSVVFIGSTDDPTTNGTWVYLAVTGQSVVRAQVMTNISRFPFVTAKLGTVGMILVISDQLTLSPPIPLRLYASPYWSNPPFLIFDIRALWH